MVIFFAAALECAAFVGLLVPGESIVLLAGFLAAQQLLDLDALIIVGAIVGDNAGYELGRRLGRPGLLRYGGRIGMTEKRLKQAERFFDHHGGKAVFLGRFVGFARALVPFIAGSSAMRYRQFLYYNALGALIWAVAFTLLGYGLSASWQVAGRWMGRASAVIGGIAVFGMLMAWVWRWLMRHERYIRDHGRHLLRP